MAEPKTIYCPRCGRKVATWDGRGTINIAGKCKKCSKLIVFNPTIQKTDVQNIPDRKQSSGIRFY